MTVRRASAADAPALSVLAAWVWMDTYASDGVRPGVLPYLAESFSDAAFRALLSDPARALWVCESDGTLQGLAQLRRGGPAPLAQAPAVELERLYVAPPCTGQGLGRELLSAARRTWSGEGLWLSVWAGNAGAQRFYDREQGRVLGETHFMLEGQAHLNLVYGWERP